MAANSLLHLRQGQHMASEMRLNQFQQQSLHFLQSGAVALLSEIEEIQEQYPELQWREDAAKEWQQGNVPLNKRKHYPGEWRLENQWRNGKFLSAEKQQANSEARQQILENYAADDESPELRATLREQIYPWQLQDKEREFCELVLQNLDAHGLNYENPIFVGAGIFPGGVVPKKRLLELLQRVQRLIPVGCACDSPLQSLLVQASVRFPGSTLQRILQGLPSLEILGGVEDFLAYLQRQGLQPRQAHEVLRELRELEPYPARGYRLANDSRNFRIYPEIQVAVGQDSTSIEIELLNNLGTKLQIVAADAATGWQNSREQQRRRQELASLLQQLQRREETLLRIAHSVFQRQSSFVTGGAPNLETLTLQMVADDVQLHISTISRCIQNKYCKTPWGTYPLRFFFNRGIRGGQSREQVKERMLAIIREYAVSSCDEKLSDVELGRRLHIWGVKIARRTVSKYRAELRKEGRL